MAYLETAPHVCIISSFERRVERVAEKKSCSWDEAAAEVKAADQNRRHFVSAHFHADLDDPKHYDIIFNTDRISVDESASLLAHWVSSPDFRENEAKKLVELRHQVLG